MSQSSVRKKRDSILLDSNYSRSNLKAMLFSIKERESGGITTIAPDAPEDKVSCQLVLLYCLDISIILWVEPGDCLRLLYVYNVKN